MSFHHIYFNDYKIGTSYECKEHKIGYLPKGVDLGVLVSKKLAGRPYDQDIILTFKKPDGTTYEHCVLFGDNYRVKQ